MKNSNLVLDATEETIKPLSQEEQQKDIKDNPLMTGDKDLVQQTETLEEQTSESLDQQKTDTVILPEQLEQDLQDLLKPFAFKKEEVKVSAMTSFIKGKMPLASALGGRASDTGDTLGTLASGKNSVSQGFHFAAVAFSALDFIRIPALYLSTWINGEKVPVSHAKNTRFAYASVLLGLAITALAAPVTAPAIAIVTASLGFAASVFHLGRHFVQKAKYNKELKQVTEALIEKENALQILQEEVKAKQLLLQNALTDNNQQAITQLKQEIPTLQQRYQTICKELQETTARKNKLEEKVKKYGSLRLVDRAVGVGLSSLGLAGVALSLFFPPVGLALVAAATIGGLAYLGGRLVIPQIKNFFNWVGSKISGTKETPAVKEPGDEPKPGETLIKGLDDTKKDSLSQQDQLAEVEVHESTADVLKELNPRHLPLETLVEELHEPLPEPSPSSTSTRLSNSETLASSLVETETETDAENDENEIAP
ncbi:coiled-coil protein (plasmid) [Legionella adelaidensis]|uniref:Coiled-coil protein n=1 Tax=Legionella adelaidensis TaxID=45056 RepID=A0A0W0R0H8_9GAMM|nr:OmpH family outer membrane protein [Legionella adelaidensis]KTC64582.1 coiled-coil protein [Legionella adelaidensis]VEH85950.1 coiled-coil protein [Legionella adelaidensis]